MEIYAHATGWHYRDWTSIWRERVATFRRDRRLLAVILAGQLWWAGAGSNRRPSAFQCHDSLFSRVHECSAGSTRTCPTEAGQPRTRRKLRRNPAPVGWMDVLSPGSRRPGPGTPAVPRRVRCVGWLCRVRSRAAWASDTRRAQAWQRSLLSTTLVAATPIRPSET